jgi:hypothetical protein
MERCANLGNACVDTSLVRRRKRRRLNRNAQAAQARPRPASAIAGGAARRAQGLPARNGGLRFRARFDIFQFSFRFNTRTNGRTVEMGLINTANLVTLNQRLRDSILRPFTGSIALANSTKGFPCANAGRPIIIVLGDWAWSMMQKGAAGVRFVTGAGR